MKKLSSRTHIHFCIHIAKSVKRYSITFSFSHLFSLCCPEVFHMLDKDKRGIVQLSLAEVMIIKLNCYVVILDYDRLVIRQNYNIN